MSRCRSILALCVITFTLGACANGGTGTYWGGGATLTPGWSRIGDAAWTAASDPFTWAPAVAAAGLQIDHADKRIARWANENTPVFGSRTAAADASDWLAGASLALYAGTGLAAPVPDDASWLGAKAKGFVVGGAAIAATGVSTELLKDATRRTRPLGRGNKSFPSGHASFAGVNARLTHDTLGYYGLSRPARIASDAGLAGLALTTGWARVEAGKHHPADVLAGAALGNFFAVFATQAFLSPDDNKTVAVNVGPYDDGWLLNVSFGF